MAGGLRGPARAWRARVDVHRRDPLRHPDFFRLARAARERAFAVRIFTNGERVDEANADWLAELRPLGIELSLHGATAAVHDAATRRPGSFAQVWRAVQALQSRRLPVVLKTLLTNANASQLDTIIALAAARGSRCASIRRWPRATTVTRDRSATLRPPRRWTSSCAISPPKAASRPSPRDLPASPTAAWAD